MCEIFFSLIPLTTLNKKKSGHRTFLLVGVTEMTWQPELWQMVTKFVQDKILVHWPRSSPTKLFDGFPKPTSTRRSFLPHLCVGRSDRVGGAVRPGSPDSPARNQRTPAREGPRRGRRTLGCPRLGRPARTSSHVTEVVEEQNMRSKK
jgi:hypothetical protein